MSNSLLNPTVIAKEALRQLSNNLVMAGLVHRAYKEEFVKVGDTVSIRRPVMFSVADGAQLNVQDVEEQSVELSVDKRKHVAWRFSTADMTLSVSDYSERYIQPAMAALAQQIDSDLHGLYRDVYQAEGYAGQPPGDFLSFSAAPRRLDQAACPRPRVGVVEPRAAYALAAHIQTLDVGRNAVTALEEGRVGRIGGVDVFNSQSVKVHTPGSFAGTPVVLGSGQHSTYAAAGGDSIMALHTAGWSPDSTVLKAGDLFTLDGVYAINPRSKEPLGVLQTFTLRADALSDSGGDAVLTISPAIVTEGPYKTVTAAPLDGAAVTSFGDPGVPQVQNLVFHRDAFALVTCPLDIPDSAGFAARQEFQGLSMRVVKAYDIESDTETLRCDVLYGVKALYPQLAVRLLG